MTIMKNGSKVFFLSLAAAVTFSACGGGGGGGSSTSSTGTTIGGAASNLPFKKGAAVTCAQINSDGSVGTSVSTTTSDASGTYSCSGVTWTGPTKVTISGDMPKVTDTVANGGAVSGTVGVIFNMGSSAKSANPTTLTTLAANKIEQGIVSAAASGSSAIDNLISSSASTVLQQLFGQSVEIPSGVNLEDLNPLGSSSSSAIVNWLNASLLNFDVQLDAAAINSGRSPLTELNTISEAIVQGTAPTLPSVTIDAATLQTNLAAINTAFTTSNGASIASAAKAAVASGGFTVNATTFAAVAAASGQTFNPTLGIAGGALTTSGSAITLTVGQIGASNSEFTLAASDGRSGSLTFTGADVTSNTTTVTSGVNRDRILLTYTPASGQATQTGLVTVTATSKTDSSKKSTLVIPYTALGANRAPTAKSGSFNTPGYLVLNLASSSVTADADSDPMKYYISMWTDTGSSFSPTMGWGAGFASTSSWALTNTAGLTFTGFTTGVAGLTQTGYLHGITKTSGYNSTDHHLTFTGANSTTFSDSRLGSLVLDGAGKVTYTRPGYGGTDPATGFTGTFGFGYAVIDSKGYGRIERIYVGVSQMGYSTTSAP